MEMGITEFIVLGVAAEDDVTEPLSGGFVVGGSCREASFCFLARSADGGGTDRTNLWRPLMRIRSD